MPGRKQPEPTESEDDHEYAMGSKREGGTKIVGDQAGFLEDRGARGRVKARREAHDIEETQRGGPP